MAARDEDDDTAMIEAALSPPASSSRAREQSVRQETSTTEAAPAEKNDTTRDEDIAAGAQDTQPAAAGKGFSTAPSQEVTERYAPGSAPHWMGAGGVVGAAACTGAAMSKGQTSTSRDDERETPVDHTDAAAETKDEGAREKSAQRSSEEATPAPVAGPSKHSIATLSRSVPVKRYDGEALVRADLQHNLLTCIFGDNQRVFRNPRPGRGGPERSSTWRTAVPAYPPGLARGATRPSNETPEEYRAYDQSRAVFENAPFEEDYTEADTLERPQTLRRKAGDLPKPGNDMLTFKELYMEQLLQSGKCTKAMREKLIADESFAEDFAKACLLVNIGRINTTLAFYPEMKTILRSYHPLPCLQKTENTRRHLQDAPRMKSLLKSVLLDDERPSQSAATGALSKNAKADKDKEDAPSTLCDIVRKHDRGVATPPTSAVNLLFILIAHSSEVTSMHFEHPHDFYTLFFPHPDHAVSSRSRARAFLWLLWHYLEGGVVLPPGTHANPFDDDRSRESTRQAREAWDKLTEGEQSKVKILGYWKGIRNPAYLEYKRQRRAAASADEKASTGEAPPEYLHRILCPRLDEISFQESAAENVDTPDELTWGAEMRDVRRNFLIRFQEEEQAKVQEGRASHDVETSVGSGRPTKKALEIGKVGKKRNAHVSGGSAYPLANILAAANAEKAAAAAKTDGSSMRDLKRQRRENGIETPEADATDAIDDKADTLWELDLSLPRHLAPSRGLLRHHAAGEEQRNDRSDSLVRVAWRRILERAQRGVGDASYESDDEEVARDEAARDERPRAELARILACLREVRTHRGSIAKP